MRCAPALPALLPIEVRAIRDVRRLLRVDVGSANRPALLWFEDKNSMRLGVETRLHLLDWRSVEVATRCQWR